MLIEAPELSSFPRIRHAFFTRQGGVSDGLYASLNGGLGSSDDPAHVAENRARMAHELGVAPQNLVSLHQIHSPEAILVEGPWGGERPRADGMATNRPDIALAIATADCGPVLFADPHGGVIGACHAGWKGALFGVLEATIARMEELGAERARIVAVLGPTIGRDNYEVGPDFAARFAEADPANARFFRPSPERDGYALFDLPGYIVARLTAAGVGEAENLDHCTYADEDRFYSYRRATHRGEPDYGRLISAIALTR
jgi:YfiH family protein